VHFAVGRSEEISLAIYDVNGRKVRQWEQREFPAGEHRVAWDSRDEEARSLPSGVYFYRLGGSVPPQTGRLVLTR
jgi:flagellar hook assembly protein FlgD